MKQIDTKTVLTNLKTVETDLENLLNQIAKGRSVEETVNHTPVAVVVVELSRTLNLVWAFQNFPIFDTTCLARMREEKFSDVYFRGINKPFTGTLYVPTFGWTTLGNQELDWNALHDVCGHYNSLNLNFDRDLIEHNKKTVERSVGPTYSVPLRTRAPKVPVDVSRKVNQVQDRFEHLVLVWEAHWTPAPDGDPLVIGKIRDQWFLIDSYDPTKLERYVVSEYSAKRSTEDDVE